MSKSRSAPKTTRPAGRARPVARLAGAALVTAALLVASAVGAGPIPALGSVLNPGSGVWASAAAAQLPTDRMLRLPSIRTATVVGFDSGGVPHVRAGSDADMFRAVGYVQARFRIFEMDLARRQAAGRLSEIVGSKALTSDEFELTIGLNRAAQRDLDQLPTGAPARAVLEEFSQGVNAAIADMEREHSLPMYFALLGYRPAPWTPKDTFLIQRLENQTLAMDARPLMASFVASKVGMERFDQWFPVLPPNPAQHPFDPGPYQKLPLAPLTAPDPAAPQPGASGATAATGAVTPGLSLAVLLDGMNAVAADVLDRMSQLPTNALHTIGNSNAWAVSGRRSASGSAILATEPHLPLTIPSTWMELTAQSPSYDMAGLMIPGVPVVLMGKTQDITWGLVNSQHGSSFYYLEKTDPAHPGQYYWDGAWRAVTKVDYRIPVKGRRPVDYVVRLTVHGPIVTEQHISAALWWAGNLPTDDLDSMLQLLRAHNFQQFHESLRGWGTPPMNFVYADRQGNVGIVNAGYGPQVASGSPWLPLSGTGESDVTGTVPFEALPLTYDPPSGYVSAANDREVTPDYPYYWGRSYDFFDQGWRQEQAAKSLGTGTISAAQMAQLNLSNIDALAPSLVPSLLAALDGQPLNPVERSARDLFAAWHYDVSPDSAAATIWQRFILLYDYDVLHPIWTYYKISAPPITPGALPEEFGSGATPSPLVGGFADDSLQGLLARLTSTDPSNAIFSPPSVPRRTAVDVLRQAFSESVKEIAARRGGNPSTWRYGDQHFVMMTSLLKSGTLDAGPYSYGGDGYTIDALLSNPIVRGGKPLGGVHRGGSSWRYVMDWGTGDATSSFPGGTSENPASPWYDNGIADWLAGKYTPMLSGDAAIAASKGRTWTLRP